MIEEYQAYILGIVPFVVGIIVGWALRNVVKRKNKIKLTGLKTQIEEAHMHLQGANQNLGKLYKIFNTLENRQEEFLDGNRKAN